MKTKTKSILKHLTVTLLVAFIGLTLWYRIQQHRNNKPLYFFGYKPVIMMDDTMKPTIQQYDIVITRNNPSDLQEQDLIYFSINKRNHSIERIIAIKEKGYVTKREYTDIKSPPFLPLEGSYSEVIAIIPTGVIIMNWLWVFSFFAIVLVVRLIYKHKKKLREAQTDNSNLQ